MIILCIVLGLGNQILLIHSYCKKQLKYVRLIIIIQIIVIQFALTLVPDKDQGIFNNFLPLFGTLCSALSLEIFCFTLSLSQVSTLSPKLTTILAIASI